jgi:hypothetical protein
LHLQNVVFILIISVLLISCSNAKRFRRSQQLNEVVSTAGVPDKMWSGDYHTYRNGRYTFTKGRYSKIYFRKMYLKRSLRGYTTRKEKFASQP